MRQHKQHKSGFTLIEVAAALVVVGLLLTAALQLQSFVIASSSRARNRVVRGIGLWNAFMYAQRQPWYQKREEQQDAFLAEDDVTYAYVQQTVSEQSVLAQYAQLGVMEYITGTWDDGTQVTLPIYRYQPREQEAAE